MAIHPDFPGLEVTVNVRNAPLPEYDDNISKPLFPKQSVMKFVEAKAGLAFEVKFSMTSEFAGDDDIELMCSIDGGRDMRKAYKLDDCTIIGAFDSTQEKIEDHWVVREMCFEQLLIDQTRSRTLKEIFAYNLVGTIKVLVRFGIVNAEVKQVWESHLKPSFGSIPPSALAARNPSLQAVYGRTCNKEPYASSDFERSDDSRYVEFVFRYRTRENLQALGVIPNTAPAPARSPAIIPKSELLVLIKHYRGNTEGLENLPEKDPNFLLDCYRNQPAVNAAQ